MDRNEAIDLLEYLNGNFPAVRLDPAFAEVWIKGLIMFGKAEGGSPRVRDAIDLVVKQATRFPTMGEMRAAVYSQQLAFKYTPKALGPSEIEERQRTRNMIRHTLLMGWYAAQPKDRKGRRSGPDMDDLIRERLQAEGLSIGSLGTLAGNNAAYVRMLDDLLKVDSNLDLVKREKAT